MYPFFYFEWDGSTKHLATTDLILVACVLLVGAWSFFQLQKKIPRWKIIVLIFATVIAGFFGGRLFHLIIERPHFTLRDLLKFDGMTFYGSLIGGMIALWLMPILLRLQQQTKIVWEQAALATGVSYAFMRLGCFFNGCCWGKFCVFPWAVTYWRDDTVMPYKGVPVHPVQLYDAFGGLLLFGFLLALKKGKSSLPLPLVFLMGYGVLRFVTEMFRGDSFRGVQILGYFSTSQIISLTIFFAAYFVLVFQKWRST